MPELDLKPDRGEHALFMIRAVLLGMSEMEREGGFEAGELTDIRTLANINIIESVKLLDLYLTGSVHRRNDDENDVINLVHHGEPWVVSLSNRIVSLVTLRKPSSIDVKLCKIYINLHRNGPLDEEIMRRWDLIDNKETRPGKDVIPGIKEIKNLVG